MPQTLHYLELRTTFRSLYMLVLSKNGLLLSAAEVFFARRADICASRPGASESRGEDEAYFNGGGSPSPRTRARSSYDFFGAVLSLRQTCFRRWKEGSCAEGRRPIGGRDGITPCQSRPITGSLRRGGMIQLARFFLTGCKLVKKETPPVFII